MNNDELSHYGVLGMKWGRRKGSASRGGNKVGKKAKALTPQQIKAKKVKRIKNAIALAYIGARTYKMGKIFLKAYLQSNHFKARYKKAKQSYHAYKSIKLAANTVSDVVKPLIIEGKFV